MLSGHGLVKRMAEPFARPDRAIRIRRPSTTSVVICPISGRSSSFIGTPQTGQFLLLCVHRYEVTGARIPFYVAKRTVIACSVHRCKRQDATTLESHTFRH